MNKTIIYKNRDEFLARDDKKLNGVSPEFAKNNPEWEKQNATNEGAWNCSDCSDCYGCSRCYDCSDCYGCYDCSRCYDCSDCYGCYDCSRCYDCSDCYGCYDCYDCSDQKNSRPVKQPKDITPTIPNIHQTVLAAVEKPCALDMRDWHTCDTTHCRAGWVVTLAGPAGKELEKRTSTLFAAMQIYHKSSPDIRVSPVRFFDPNEAALADIKRCAELEKAAAE